MISPRFISLGLSDGLQQNVLEGISQVVVLVTIASVGFFRISCEAASHVDRLGRTANPIASFGVVWGVLDFRAKEMRIMRKGLPVHKDKRKACEDAKK